MPGIQLLGKTPVVDTLIKFQSGFFDRQKVIKSLTKTEQGVMSRFGAFVRTHAQGLMLRHVVRRGFGVKSKVTNRDGYSKPGEPPYVHEGSLVKRLYFAYDPATHSVVVGPDRLNMVFFDKNRKPIRGTVPGVLERGGQVTILERQRRSGEWVRADLRTRRFWGHMPTRYRTVTIAARPYMNPSLMAELPKFAPLFAKLGISERAA